MTIATNQLKTEIIYPNSDGQPMAESDPARDYLIYCVEALDLYFADRPNVYVSGNLFIYYRQSVPSAVVAPDVFVVFGVEKKKRLNYKVWQENDLLPSFVLEITSATTQENDEQEKPIKYANLGVQEYFQYDPTGDYLDQQLKGRTLVNGIYQDLPAQFLDNGELAIESQTLGLTLRLINGELRFFNQNRKLLSHRETEQARQQAIPRLLAMGLTNEQVAEALGFELEEILRYNSQ